LIAYFIPVKPYFLIHFHHLFCYILHDTNSSWATTTSTGYSCYNCKSIWGYIDEFFLSTPTSKWWEKGIYIIIITSYFSTLEVCRDSVFFGFMTPCNVFSFTHIRRNPKGYYVEGVHRRSATRHFPHFHVARRRIWIWTRVRTWKCWKKVGWSSNGAVHHPFITHHLSCAPTRWEPVNE